MENSQGEVGLYAAALLSNYFHIFEMQKGIFFLSWRGIMMTLACVLSLEWKEEFELVGIGGEAIRGEEMSWRQQITRGNINYL